MRGTVAKRIRAEARAATVGRPGRAYVVYGGREFRVHPQSTRGVYLRAKRAYKQG